MIDDKLINRLRAWEGCRFPMPLRFEPLHRQICDLSPVTGVHADGGFFAYIVHGDVWPELAADKWHFVNPTDGELLTFDTWDALTAELDLEDADEVLGL